MLSVIIGIGACLLAHVGTSGRSLDTNKIAVSPWQDLV